MTEARIPYARQDINEADVEAVVETLRSDWLTQGPVLPAFERAVAKACDAVSAVAANSGTSALHVACAALGIGPGDLVWTSPNTFVASANCARYCGATVGFVDIDRDTWNLSVEALEKKLASAKTSNKPLPKLLIPVHFAGQSCDMEAIARLAAEYDFRVLEDASHALGGSYRGIPVGACRFSDITVFSFHPVKIITTGEGGMALTRDTALAERMRRLCRHGIVREPESMTHPSDGPWYYEQVELGYNYRMTDIQAALGLSQLARMRQFVDRRNVLAAQYDEALRGLPLRTQRMAEGVRSSRHLYPVCVPADRRLHVFEFLRARGIGVGVHYIPVHLQPAYRSLGFSSGDFPAAEEYYRGAISLPMSAVLTDSQQERVVEALGKALA